MDPFRGIIIEVISEGQNLPLYDDPDIAEHEDAPDPYHQFRYVEATPGAKFEVVIRLTPQFPILDPGPGEGIKYSVRYDGGSGRRFFDPYPTILHSWQTQQAAKVTFSRAGYFDESSRQHMSGDTTFSALTIGESVASGCHP